MLAIYLLLAFCSFDKKGESKAVCSKVNINIADSGTNGFLDANTIKRNLQKAKCYPAINTPVASINTRKIEEVLIERTPFVKTAECYKTIDGHVYITVTQRLPVIRIMAENGDNYYVDDNDRIMKGSSYTSDLIIASGCINKAFATTYLSPLGKVIMANEMWRNLIEQINVLPDRSIEIIPRIGNHIVCLGRLPEAKNKEQREKAILEFMQFKMTRLEKFYKYGLSVVGWNKYSYINIEFDNQIVCQKRDNVVKSSEPLAAEPTNEVATANNETHSQDNNAETAQQHNENAPASQANEAKKAKEQLKKLDDKKEDNKKAPNNKTADKKITDKKTTDKKVAGPKSADKKSTDKKTSDKKVSDKKMSDKKTSDKKTSDKKKS